MLQYVSTCTSGNTWPYPTLSDIWYACVLSVTSADGLARVHPRKYAQGFVLLWLYHHFLVDSCHFNTSRPRQNGRRFADDTFKRIFLNENVRISIKISLKFVPKGPINNNPALVQIMAWRLPGDKPLSEPMMVRLLTHIYASLGLNELKSRFFGIASLVFGQSYDFPSVLSTPEGYWYNWLAPNQRKPQYSLNHNNLWMSATSLQLNSCNTSSSLSRAVVEKCYEHVVFHRFVFQISYVATHLDPNKRNGCKASCHPLKSSWKSLPSEGHFKNAYELVNLGALKFSLLNKLHIFQCMGQIFCVEFQSPLWNSPQKYLTHTLKDAIFEQR